MARWLIIVPVVLLLLFGCSHLALLAAPPLPNVDTRSKLQADYHPWLLATIPAISSAIVTEIVQGQATKVSNPVTVTDSIWSTPEPTVIGVATDETPNSSSATATSSNPLSPTLTTTPLTTSTRTPTPKATVTLTRTPFPTFTRTATRTFAPIPTRTPTPVPTSTFTAVPPTNTSAPPPPATTTPTRTNTPVVPPTNTPTRTNTPISPTNTPTPTNTPIIPPTNTPTPTDTPVVPPPDTPTPTNTPTDTPIPPACLISAGGTGGGGSSFSWSITNSGVVTVNLTSVSTSWAQPGDVWQSLDFGGSQVWSGAGINTPGGTVPTSGAVDLPPGSKSLSFNFNNLTSGVTYSVSASFDNGCSVNGSFTA